MRLLLVGLFIAPLLSGCGNPGTQTPLVNLSPDEVRPHYVNGPRLPFPDFTAFTLGETYALNGLVASWRATRPVPLYMFSATGQDVPVGEVQPGGQITGTAPLGGDQTVPLLQELGTGSSTVPTAVCPVHELDALATVTLQVSRQMPHYKLKDVTVSVTPQTSPVTTVAPIVPDLTAYGVVGWPDVRWVYAAQDVTVRGEQRCVSGYRQGSTRTFAQENVRVNFSLTRGWNALLRRSTSSYAGETSIHDVEWTTLPREAVERWR
ncbi:hypothetical protein [Deinococcus radiotolerans]|nr:hypothetical protein [Deinococcus radiotolerans]